MARHHTHGHSRSQLSPLQSRYLNQAQLLATVRYQPERNALIAALSDLAGQRDSGLTQAAGARRASEVTLDAVRPRIESVYHEYGAGGAPPSLPADLRDLGPGVDRFKAAFLLNQGNAQASMNREASRALGDVENYRVAADQRERLERDAATREFAGGQAKIAGRLQDLASEEGNFTAATLGSLVDKALTRAITRTRDQRAHDDRVAGQRISSASQQETARHNAYTETHPSSSSAGSAKPLTPEQKAKRASLISSIEHNAREYRTLLNSRHTGGVRKGQKWTAREVAQHFRSAGVQNEAALSAISDLATRGYVQDHNVKALEPILYSRQVPSRWVSRRRPTYAQRPSATTRPG